MGRATGRPTIYDVAKESGVSPATVSRSIRTPDRVHPSTRARITESIERLGYQRTARSAGERQFGTVAIVVPDITNPYYFSAITGAEGRAQAAGLTLVIVNTEENPARESANIERLIGRVDGFVLASSRLTDEEILSLVGIGVNSSGVLGPGGGIAQV